MCGARGWACVTRVHVDSRGQSQVFLRCPLLFAQLFQYWGLSLEHHVSKANTYQWAPAPAPPTYFLEPSSVAWNLPSGISWLVPEPQGSACLYLPCTGITSMPPCPAFFSCALDIKLGSWCSQGKCFNDISLLIPDFCLFVCFLSRQILEKFKTNSRLLCRPWTHLCSPGWPWTQGDCTLVFQCQNYSREPLRSAKNCDLFKEQERLFTSWDPSVVS